MVSGDPPQGKDAIEAFLLHDLPAQGPAPRGAEGLDRARRFFSLLGNPQDSARQVHVVGTAGKGTAVAAIVARLVGAGAAVGAHLSPHVYDIRERFLLDGQLSSWDRLDDAMREVWPAVLQVDAEEGRPPTFFEMTTALAWLIARAAEVDYIVTEAGIGGEADATNAIMRLDKITVIMPIGYDHVEILGTKLEQIAHTKAAVITPGGIAVMAPQPLPDAEAVIVEVAEQRAASLSGIDVDPTASWPEVATGVANRILEILIANDPSLDPLTEPAAIDLPGRMEPVAIEGKVLVLDGAHNPLKLRGVQDVLDGERVDVLIAALSREKNLAACATELAQLARVVVASDFAVMAGERVVRRSWSAAELGAAIVAAGGDTVVQVVPSLKAAVDAAFTACPSGGTILATGSFMMLAPVHDAAIDR